RTTRGHRRVPAVSRLGEQHHVGLDAPMLAREKFSGASEPGLDLVGDEQCLVAAAKLRRALKVAVRGKDPTLALDRLDDERRDFAASQRTLQRRKVVERNAEAVRQ